MSVRHSGATEGRTRLLFLGDIGIDREACAAAAPALPASDLVIANLEGAIMEAAERARAPHRRFIALHNDPAVLDYLGTLGVKAVSVANNHVHDFAAPIGPTRRLLAEAGIASFGAGATLEEAAAPAVLQHGATRIVLFGFGWGMIGCHDARDAREGVNPLTAEHALETARRARAENPGAFIVFMMHWNYELELYPQPAHRQLAHELIAAGVDAIVGGHPHVAEGVEMVAGKPVAYSLGNWLFPPRVARGFHVQYPSFAQRQLALELEIEGRDVRAVRLHWYGFDPASWKISFIGSEAVGDEMVAKLTPYAGMRHDEYVQWFRAHRTRRRALPVYADIRSPANVLYDGYLRSRQAAGEVMAKLGLKAEQRRAAPARVS